jgi:hypothetical protein
MLQLAAEPAAAQPNLHAAAELQLQCEKELIATSMGLPPRQHTRYQGCGVLTKALVADPPPANTGTR